MTAVNSKLLPSLFISVLMAGCFSATKPDQSHKCQAIVVVDKTNSVDYTQKLPDLQKKFELEFDRTYACSKSGIQTSRMIIAGNTDVFPDPRRFDKACPDIEEDSRSGAQELQNWKTEKRKWMSEQVGQVVSLIQSPCNNKSTDIFSIFSGIQQVQRNGGPWDSINIFVFSDMVNTTRALNMNTEIGVNPLDKGKKACQDLIDRGVIVPVNNQNLYLTIYTPDKMDNTQKVYQFWTGFFEKFGLPKTHYHFE